MRSRSELVQIELDRMLPIIAADPTVTRVYLFGSYAGQQTGSDWSDLDLCVIQSTTLRFLDRTAYWLKKLRPACGVDLIVYTPSELDSLRADGHSFFSREVQPKSISLYAA